MIETSEVLKKSLWEYDYAKLSYTDEIVVLRALSFGEIEDIKQIASHIGEQKIIEILKKNIHQIDPKSINFWKIYFHITDLSTHNLGMYDKLNTPTFTRSFG